MHPAKDLAGELRLSSSVCRHQQLPPITSHYHHHDELESEIGTVDTIAAASPEDHRIHYSILLASTLKG